MWRKVKTIAPLRGDIAASGPAERLDLLGGEGLRSLAGRGRKWYYHYYSERLVEVLDSGDRQVGCTGGELPFFEHPSLVFAERPGHSTAVFLPPPVGRRRDCGVSGRRHRRLCVVG